MATALLADEIRRLRGLTRNKRRLAIASNAGWDEPVDAARSGGMDRQTLRTGCTASMNGAEGLKDGSLKGHPPRLLGGAAGAAGAGR